MTIGPPYAASVDQRLSEVFVLERLWKSLQSRQNWRGLLVMKRSSADPIPRKDLEHSMP